METEEIKNKYNIVESLLDDAIKKAESVELEGEEENIELAAINSMLRDISSEFKQEIDKLESSSEWDKFCIAFFGETNAGKSTIIESLRIIYDEEQRRLEKEKQEKEYEATLVNHCQQYKELATSLREINNTLINKKEPSRFLVFLKYITLVILGIGIGFALAYLRI